MSETEKRIARETAAEIARLEGQIKTLRQFQKLIDPKGICRKKRKYTRKQNTTYQQYSRRSKTFPVA